MPKLDTVKRGVIYLLCVIFSALSSVAYAQQESKPLLEEVTVTATKRMGGESIQDAPTAITAYTDSQLDAMYLRDLKAIGYSAPNVQMEDIGTARGIANFSIRGLGVNSSIPSIEPTVGVFVDGMYLGINSGVVLDVFDLEGIEVLRGPQGVLFGRNVTGGAVLLRTSSPSKELNVNSRVAYESGSSAYFSSVVSGPLTEMAAGKIALYHHDDGGWFENKATGDDYGESETNIIRGALSFDLSDAFNIVIRVEQGGTDGDGPAAQNAGLFDTDSFDFSIDNSGIYDTDWDQAITEATWNVGFGEDGQIVNVLGWRDYSSRTGADIDATPNFLFHSDADTKQDQISNELRYSGSFGNVSLTSGIYYFTQDINYFERRRIPVASLDVTGGGDQEQETMGLFTQVDIALNEIFTLNVGGRYTREEKDARIATITLNQCTFGVSCATYDFVDANTWSNVTPKLGVQVRADSDTLAYAFWTRGFRSGGYNLRHTAIGTPNEGFDEETQSSWEIGVKKDFADSQLRMNVAAFHNTIDNLQREVNVSDPTVAVVQLIRNTAEATITGAEIELQALVTENLYFSASIGYVDGEYDEVKFDLSRDGVIDDVDLGLDLPRLAPWSYGAQIAYERDLPVGSFTAQVSGYHRDSAAYTDDNRGRLRSADMFDASLALRFGGNKAWKVSAFGKNLKNESTVGGDTQLPFFPGATFSPLNKGRIYGLEIQYSD